ncbi:MAG: polysaccharide deacetylase family protein [Clostridia bacterium]|nr:polysaccharide deacetylase family protein [Clostridia bacterium]
MIQFHVYPGGKKRVVTFSYDDGHVNDGRLIELFNKYGVKGTFHLNGSKYFGIDESEKAALRARYAGHEVACHTVRHGWPSRMPMQSVVSETFEDRKILEDIFGYPIIGMSYPSGSYDKDAIAAMRACGIVYSRTTIPNKNFAIPEDFMEWHATCHHRDALPLCEKFMADIDSQWTRPMFYIWGHAHELVTEENWEYMEKIVSSLAGSEKIWYATNIEIYNYMEAQSRLRISADETIFYNPTDITVWVERDKKDIIEIPAGATVKA